MLKLTGANGTPVWISLKDIICLRIPSAEAWGDEARTIIGLTDGFSFAVKEPPEEVLAALPT